MSASVPERLATLETVVVHLHEDIKDQRSEGEAIHNQILDKVNELLIAKAKDEGEREANKRLAGVVALAVSAGVSLLGLACNYMF